MRRALIALAMVPAFTSMSASAELVPNGSFDVLDGWWATENLTLETRAGELCTLVPGGLNNPWDAIVGTNDLPLAKGDAYQFSFAYRGDPAGPVRALVQMPVDPWTSYTEATPRAGLEQKVATRKFKSPVDRPDAQIVFQIGGAKEAWTFCLDHVSLTGGTEIVAYRPETGPRIRVNQVGYLPNGPKHATLVSDAATAMPFQLVDSTGETVFDGSTVPRGLDPSAGVKVHTLDFSTTTATGDGFTVSVDGQTSYPFDIRADLYATLVVDAMSYFYPVRSGIAIDAAIAGDGYGRPAGHIGIAPNKGDTSVGCQPAEVSHEIYGEPWTCDYTLDVSGGWYDAGDHGKYVVNGGISAGQLHGRIPPRLPLRRTRSHARRQAAHPRARQRHPRRSRRGAMGARLDAEDDRA